MVASLQVLRKLCSYLFFYVLFLTLFAKKISSVIIYSQEELLDIKVTSNYQHYDQEYVFPKADPSFEPSPWTWDLIPEAGPKQRGHPGHAILSQRQMERPTGQTQKASTPSIASEHISRQCTRWTKLEHELPSRKHGSLWICCQSP